MHRRTALRTSLLCAAALSAFASSAAAAEPFAKQASKQRLLAERDRVAAATVTLPERSCAGAVAGSRATVVTAAHCIHEGATRVDVATRDGELMSAGLLHLDRESDLALLGLDRELSVEPLALADALPRRGDRLLFVGRVDRASRTQVVRVEKLDQCPSLPDVPQAVFTSVQARPGDSGAPLVELARGGELRVVGVVHGGARCHIAAPTAPLASVLLAVPPVASSAPAAAQPPSATPAKPPARTLESKRLGPFVFERTPDGFRFSFKFNVEWRSDGSP